MAGQRAARDGGAAGARGAGGVLGLLPAAFAADAALPQGVGRALPRARADRRLRALAGLRGERGRGERSRRRASAWGSCTRCCWTATSRCGASTRTRAGRGATCGGRTACSSTTTTARAPTRSASCAIGEALGIAVEPIAPLRPEDAPGASVAPASPDRLEPPFDGPYEAGAVWAVLDGRGLLRVNGREIDVAWPGAHLLIEHDGHGAGELALEPGEGVSVEAVCFTPGLDAARAPADRGR